MPTGARCPKTDGSAPSLAQVYDHDDLHRFMRYSINNLGDPFIPSNYGVHSREFEVAVMDFFANLWKIDKGDYWGYVTTCGTESNLHGMLLARECHPNGVLYTSKETHYSIFKASVESVEQCTRWSSANETY